MSEYQFVLYETLDEGRIARVMLNRPEARNAQNRGLLVELNEALLRAEADDEVRVAILGGMGPMFSAGHDLGSKLSMEELMPGPKQHRTRKINGGTRQGAEGLMLEEWCGVEYFAHPWELGPRKAKELMLTGDALDADDAVACGMVTKVFPPAELSDRTLEFARRIAQLPTMSALLIREAVNQSVDNMGFYNALNACFTLHELNHSHRAQVNDDRFPIAKEDAGIPNWRNAPPIVRAVKDRVRADE